MSVQQSPGEKPSFNFGGRVRSTQLKSRLLFNTNKQGPRVPFSTKDILKNRVAEATGKEKQMWEQALLAVTKHKPSAMREHQRAFPAHQFGTLDSFMWDEPNLAVKRSPVPRQQKRRERTQFKVCNAEDTVDIHGLSLHECESKLQPSCVNEKSMKKDDEEVASLQALGNPETASQYFLHVRHPYNAIFHMMHHSFLEIMRLMIFLKNIVITDLRRTLDHPWMQSFIPWPLIINLVSTNTTPRRVKRLIYLKRMLHFQSKLFEKHTFSTKLSTCALFPLALWLLREFGFGKGKPVGGDMHKFFPLTPKRAHTVCGLNRCQRVRVPPWRKRTVVGAQHSPRYRQHGARPIVSWHMLATPLKQALNLHPKLALNQRKVVGRRSLLRFVH
jgi:hypothetical protein